MKRNLKNRPRIEFKIICKNKRERKAIDDSEKWFSEFEKELREKLKRVRSKQRSYSVYDSGVRFIIEEILGE